MEYVLFLVFGVILAVILALVFIKDSETNKKFERYEKVLEGVIQENFNLKKQLSTLSSVKDGEIVDLGALQESFDKKIETCLNEKLIPILNSLNNIGNTIDEFQNEQQSRMYNLEERTRDITRVSSVAITSEDEQILRLYKEGKSVESIAKDLRVGVGRVEFALKMQDIQ